MDAIRKRWRVDEVRALPDDGSRYEVIRGVLLVTPAPRPIHQRAVLLLAMMLEPYCERTGIGRVYQSPADIEFDDETMVQPDLLVIPGRTGRVPSSWRMMAKPLLAVEAISPSSARADRQEKRRTYLAEGIEEYWIVDIDSRLVERWRPGDSRPEILDQRLEWHADPGVDALVIDLVDYFARVWGE